jgi:hypothetical protein
MSLRPAQTKLARPYLRNKIQIKGLRCGSSSRMQVGGPGFNPQYHIKNNNINKNLTGMLYTSVNPESISFVVPNAFPRGPVLPFKVRGSPSLNDLQSSQI